MEAAKNPTCSKYVSSGFSLPLFMLSRNRIKYSRFNELKKYIKKRTHLYDKHDDQGFERATIQHLEHLVGSMQRQSSLKDLASSNIQWKSSPKLLEKSWQLPPNLYDTTKIPYEGKMGIGGAHWPKDHTHRARIRPGARQPHTSYYSFPDLTEKMFAPCNRTKGAFLTNARDRRATTRCMVSNIATCHKNPSDPGPATYNPIYVKKSFSIGSKPQEPHLFYRSSVVPMKENSIHTPHISFTAAPGRYETRYPSICPCSSKLIYQPQLDILVDIEKRKKFRRLPYEKLKGKHYTSPDWRHVTGRGFRYLFKGFKPLPRKRLAQQETKTQKTIQLYPDSKYLSMINHPSRKPLSLRSGPFLRSIPRITFNCVAKTVTRKHLKSNKKIAFSSTQERFPDGYRMPILTQKQQRELQQSLPLERQLLDYPVMKKRLSEIKLKLHQTPKHMLPNYVPKLRKKIFKFQPLPQAKVLVTEDDTNVEEDSKEGFYLSLPDAKAFFKDSETF